MSGRRGAHGVARNRSRQTCFMDVISLQSARRREASRGQKPLDLVLEAALFLHNLEAKAAAPGSSAPTKAAAVSPQPEKADAASTPRKGRRTGRPMGRRRARVRHKETQHRSVPMSSERNARPQAAEVTADGSRTTNFKAGAYIMTGAHRSAKWMSRPGPFGVERFRLALCRGSGGV